MTPSSLSTRTYIVTVLAILTNKATAQATPELCFFLNGAPAANAFRCDNSTASATSHSTCCNAGDICWSNGVCQGVDNGVQEFLRVACTDPTWRAGECLNKCKNDSVDGNAALRVCGKGGIQGSDEYCCAGDDAPGDDACCVTSRHQFTLAIPSVLARIPVTTPSAAQSTTAIITTSNPISATPVSSTSAASATAASVSSVTEPSTTVASAGSLTAGSASTNAISTFPLVPSSTESPPPNSAPLTSDSSSSSKPSNLGVKLGVSIPFTFIAIVGIVLASLWFLKRRQRRRKEAAEEARDNHNVSAMTGFFGGPSPEPFGDGAATQPSSGPGGGSGNGAAQLPPMAETGGFRALGSNGANGTGAANAASSVSAIGPASAAAFRQIAMGVPSERAIANGASGQATNNATMREAPDFGHFGVDPAAASTGIVYPAAGNQSNRNVRGKSERNVYGNLILEGPGSEAYFGGNVTRAGDANGSPIPMQLRVGHNPTNWGTGAGPASGSRNEQERNGSGNYGRNGSRAGTRGPMNGTGLNNIQEIPSTGYGAFGNDRNPGTRALQLQNPTQYETIIRPQNYITPQNSIQPQRHHDAARQPQIINTMAQPQFAPTQSQRGYTHNYNEPLSPLSMSPVSDEEKDPFRGSPRNRRTTSSIGGLSAVSVESPVLGKVMPVGKRPEGAPLRQGERYL